MIISEEAYLQHYGVKGMKWGQRTSRPEGVTRRTNREASKDAKEFARAKQYFGEGAGNRRKLIKNSVEAKKKRDPAYAKAFDQHLSRQDAAKHVEKAKKERKSTDRRTRNKQRVGAAARTITGSQGTQAAFVALALGGAAFVASPKGRAMMSKAADTVKQAAKNASENRKQQAAAKFINEYFIRQGL